MLTGYTRGEDDAVPAPRRAPQRGVAPGVFVFATRVDLLQPKEAAVAKTGRVAARP